MAHITCQKHGFRVHVFKDSPKGGAKVIHRQDGSHCQSKYIKYRRRVLTADAILQAYEGVVSGGEEK